MSHEIRPPTMQAFCDTGLLQTSLGPFTYFYVKLSVMGRTKDCESLGWSSILQT